MENKDSAKEHVPRVVGRKVWDWKDTKRASLSTEGDSRDITKLWEYSQALGGRHNARANHSQRRILMELVSLREQSCSKAAAKLS